MDAHQQVQVAVTRDERGHVLGQWRGPKAPHGWAELASWAARWATSCQGGSESAWTYGRGWAQHLLAQGARLDEVPPRWTARERRAARPRGTHDRLDAAQAVAGLVWRAGETRPQVQRHDEASALDLLVTARDGALAAATRLRNQLHALWRQLDPPYRAGLPCRQTPAGLRGVRAETTTSPVPLHQTRAAAVRRTAQRLRAG